MTTGFIELHFVDCSFLCLITHVRVFSANHESAAGTHVLDLGSACGGSQIKIIWVYFVEELGKNRVMYNNLHLSRAVKILGLWSNTLAYFCFMVIGTRHETPRSQAETPRSQAENFITHSTASHVSSMCQLSLPSLPPGSRKGMHRDPYEGQIHSRFVSRLKRLNLDTSLFYHDWQAHLLLLLIPHCKCHPENWPKQRKVVVLYSWYTLQGPQDTQPMANHLFQQFPGLYSLTSCVPITNKLRRGLKCHFHF